MVRAQDGDVAPTQRAFESVDWVNPELVVRAGRVRAMRWVWMALLVGCGASSPTPSTSTETTSPDQTTGVEATTPVEPERVNLSAGGPHAEPALVPQRSHRGFSRIHVVRDRPLAITGSENGGLVTLIDIPSGHVRAARRFVRSAITRLNSSDDGSRVLVAGTRYYGGDNPRMGIWDLRDDSFTVLKEMERQLAGAVISPDGERVAFVTYEYEGPTKLHLVSSRGGDAVIREIPTASRLVWTRDGSAIAVSTDDAVLIVDPESADTRETIALDHTRAFHVSDNGRWLVALGRNAVVVFNAQGQVRARLEVEAAHARLTPNGAELMLCVDGALDVRSGRDLSTSRETEVRCNAQHPIDARLEPMALGSQGAKLYVRTDGAEPEELDLELYETPFYGFPESPRRRWFLVGRMRELYIYNLRLKRLRRLVSEGATESSAWSVERVGDRVRLRGRSWQHDFPSAAEPVSEDRAVTWPDDAAWLSTSPDGQAALVVVDPYGAPQPTLFTADGRPRRLSLPPRAEFDCYDYEDGFTCGGDPVWGPDNQFVFPIQEGLVAYGSNGRRVGYSTTGRGAEYADDSTLLVEHADGSLSLANTRFQRRARVFNAREGGAVRTALDGRGRLAATRGRVLQVVDVASGEQQHRIELTEPATSDPTFVDDQVQLRTRDAFLRWSLNDASETMRVTLDDIRALSENESEALYCAEGRLRWRLLAQEASTDLMPCPQPGWMRFDGDFVYWVEGNAGNVLRRADGQRIRVRALERGAHGFATTPQGHVFASSAEVLRQLRMRSAGAIFEAELSEIDEARLSPQLFEEFFSGRPLSAAPTSSSSTPPPQ